MIHIRVVLGALFGLLLSLPSSRTAFVEFTRKATTLNPETATQTDLLKDGIFLLLPFLCGFSTVFVLTVLNKVIAAFNSFLGGVNVGLPGDPHVAADRAAAD